MSGYIATIHEKNAEFFEGKQYKIRTSIPEEPEETNRLIRSFIGLAGNPIEQGAVNSPASAVSAVSVGNPLHDHVMYSLDVPLRIPYVDVNPRDDFKGLLGGNHFFLVLVEEMEIIVVWLASE